MKTKAILASVLCFFPAMVQALNWTCCNCGSEYAVPTAHNCDCNLAIATYQPQTTEDTTISSPQVCSEANELELNLADLSNIQSQGADAEQHALVELVASNDLMAGHIQAAFQGQGPVNVHSTLPFYNMIFSWGNQVQNWGNDEYALVVQLLSQELVTALGGLESEEDILAAIQILHHHPDLVNSLKMLKRIWLILNSSESVKRARSHGVEFSVLVKVWLKWLRAHEGIHDNISHEPLFLAVVVAIHEPVTQNLLDAFFKDKNCDIRRGQGGYPILVQNLDHYFQTHFVLSETQAKLLTDYTLWWLRYNHVLKEILTGETSSDETPYLSRLQGHRLLQLMCVIDGAQATWVFAFLLHDPGNLNELVKQAGITDKNKGSAEGLEKGIREFKEKKGKKRR